MEDLIDNDTDDYTVDLSGLLTTNWVDKKCNRVEYFTPENILGCTRHYFGGPIPLDPATISTNPTKAEIFYTQAEDGLILPWDHAVFVNPPYGRVIKDWTKKIRDSSELGTQIIALLPCGARFSTRYWQDNILSDCLDVICFVRGRVSFLDEQGNKVGQNPYDSAIYGYNVDGNGFVEAFRKLGKILKVSL